MTREEALHRVKGYLTDIIPVEDYSEVEEIIKALEQEPNIKSLGEDMRICRESITDEKVLIGFNMAVALCNKHFAGSEVQE